MTTRRATPGTAAADEDVPETLPAARRAGVCLHVTSLPGDYGIGEIGDAAFGFIDRMAEMALRVWQFLPLGPTAYGDSPYQPLSTFAGNELLVDTAALLRGGLVTEAEAGSLRSLPSDRVDYGALISRKAALLDRAAGRFEARADAADRAAFDAFLEAHDRAWLHDYALFRILKARHGERPWPEWPPRYVHREAAALRGLEAEAGREIDAIRKKQFLFDRQWQRLRAYAAEHGIMLFGDMPICIALDSADAWANRDIVCLDRDGRPAHVAGVPPDYFSEDGQLWGNPLYDWDRHAATGFRWWIERLRRSTDLADIVRIDHFRGFEAYWAVPAGARSARDGEWRPGPGDAIFEALRAALGHLPIVAEDLGVITPEVEALRDRHGLPGMQVLQFEVGRDDFDLGDIGENRVCYSGTHDNDTTLGWFRGSPGDRRTRDEIERTRRAALRATNGRPETIHLDMIRLALESRARLAIAPMQDFLGLGSEARLNTPGTAGGNWRWRIPPNGMTPAFTDSVADLVDAAGRCIA